MLALIFFGIAGIVLMWLLSPFTVALMGISGLFGVLVHEALHALAAVLRGRKILDIGWDGMGLYVEYEADGVDLYVQLMPTVAGGVYLLIALYTIPYPNVLIPASFALAVAFAPLDWADSYSAMQRNAS